MSLYLKYRIQGDRIIRVKRDVERDETETQKSTKKIKQYDLTKYITRKGESMQRAKSNCNAILHCNPELNTLLTLTFKENIIDPEEAEKEFHKFNMRFGKELNKQGIEFKYVKVMERQQRGAIHYHLMTNLPYIRWEHIQEVWGQGFINIEHVKGDLNRTRNYLLKYVTKAMEEEASDQIHGDREKEYLELGFNHRIWTASGNLRKETVIREEDTPDLAERCQRYIDEDMEAGLTTRKYMPYKADTTTRVTIYTRNDNTRYRLSKIIFTEEETEEIEEIEGHYYSKETGEKIV